MRGDSQQALTATTPSKPSRTTPSRATGTNGAPRSKPPHNKPHNKPPNRPLTGPPSVPGRAGWELRAVVQAALSVLAQTRALGPRALATRPVLRRRDAPRVLWRCLLM